MKIQIKARPNAYEQRIEKIDNSNFIVSVKEPPIKGQANRAIVRALANYFGVPQSQVRIVSGFVSREKIIEINKKTG